MGRQQWQLYANIGLNGNGGPVCSDMKSIGLVTRRGTCSLMISLIHARSAVTWGYFLSSFAFAGSTDNLDSSLHFYGFTQYSI